MSGWVRRNARWLGALALVLPASAAVSFTDSWREYRDHEWRIAHHATAGESVAYAGVNWSLIELTDETDDLLSEPLPEGTAFFVASIQIEGPDDRLAELYACDLRLTDGERHWSQVSYGEVAWTSADDYSVGCADATKVQVGFLVPAAAAPELREQGRLEISTIDDLPHYISFQP